MPWSGESGQYGAALQPGAVCGLAPGVPEPGQRDNWLIDKLEPERLSFRPAPLDVGWDRNQAATFTELEGNSPQGTGLHRLTAGVEGRVRRVGPVRADHHPAHGHGLAVAGLTVIPDDELARAGSNVML